MTLLPLHDITSYYLLAVALYCSCLFDYIDIFTIDVDQMKNLENRLCGGEIPRPFVSIHSRVELVFKSDYAGARKGFLGQYEFLEESQCISLCQIQFSFKSNLIRSCNQIFVQYGIHYPLTRPDLMQTSYTYKQRRQSGFKPGES